MARLEPIVTLCRDASVTPARPLHIGGESSSGLPHVQTGEGRPMIRRRISEAPLKMVKLPDGTGAEPGNVVTIRPG
jgi:hypothetical protein